MSAKPVVKAVMRPFSDQVEINVSQGGQKTIRGNAFPGIAVGENESQPVLQGNALGGNKARKKATLITFFHGQRSFSIDEHLRAGRFGMETAYDDSSSLAGVWMHTQDTVGIRVLYPDQPFDIFC
jgi:hypothetical protein